MRVDLVAEQMMEAVHEGEATVIVYRRKNDCVGSHSMETYPSLQRVYSINPMQK